MLQRIEPEGLVGRLDVDAVEVRVIGSADLGSVKLRAADEKMNQILRLREA
jgi:hypothetical protein